MHGSSSPNLWRALGLALSCGVLAAAPLAALVYVLPTDESMVSRSPVIVYGTVRTVDLPAGPRPSTEILFDIEEVLKGTAPAATIAIRQPGGYVDEDTAMKVLGLPMMAEGDRMLLFLAPHDGAYRTVDLSLGMFFEVGALGHPLLVRDMTMQDQVETPGDAGAAGETGRGSVRSSAAFRRWIADRASGVERPPDYFESNVPRRLLSVSSPYRLTRTQDTCFYNDLPVRWRVFDRGASVGLWVASRGQTGVPGGGFNELATALRAWNSDPQSRVRLVQNGTSSQQFEINRVDGLNSITYEDPHDEIAGSYRSGGILSVTSVFYNCGRPTPPHGIPGRSSIDALEIVEANITTQDGYRNWLSSTGNASASHEEIMGHEVGHLLGIAHSCGDFASGACRRGSDADQALMRTGAHADGRGATLNIDDRVAVRFLYPGQGEVVEPEPDPEPEPEPDPEPNPNPTAPGEYSPCQPDSAALRFDGGYEVRLCYETQAGVIGRGRSGIWASTEAGLLWFFNRDNAEVLIKVLDGCQLNGHRWVFVAPVTDLAFNLEIRDSRGRVWKQRNRQGQTAEARGDTSAFTCDLS